MKVFFFSNLDQSHLFDVYKSNSDVITAITNNTLSFFFYYPMLTNSYPCLNITLGNCENEDKILYKIFSQLQGG